MPQKRFLPQSRSVFITRRSSRRRLSYIVLCVRQAAHKNSAFNFRELSLQIFKRKLSLYFVCPLLVRLQTLRYILYALIYLFLYADASPALFLNSFTTIECLSAS